MNIVVTGYGCVSAAGNSLDATLRAFRSGARNSGPVTLFETELRYPVFEVQGIPGEGSEDYMRTVHLCLHAVREALDAAGLEKDLSDKRVGVCLGTTVASQLNDVGFYRAFRSGKDPDLNSVDRFLKGNLAEVICREIHAQGPAATVVNACSSGTDAIGIALSWLRAGYCDIVIAGGADELNRVPLAGFGSLGVVSDELCAPFDKNRKGLNLGEGAGVVILETEDSARERGRGTSIMLAGYGLANDAFHLTAPASDGVGLRCAIERALSEASITGTDIDFINAHGTATRDNDKVEGLVFKELFGDDIAFFSTKGFTGHTLGAAGGLEAVFTIACLKKQWIPQSVGFVTCDDQIGISPVTEARDIRATYALSTSLAFGGNNSALIFKREN